MQACRVNFAVKHVSGEHSTPLALEGGAMLLQHACADPCAFAIAILAYTDGGGVQCACARHCKVDSVRRIPFWCEVGGGPGDAHLVGCRPEDREEHKAGSQSPQKRKKPRKHHTRLQFSLPFSFSWAGVRVWGFGWGREGWGVVRYCPKEEEVLSSILSPGLQVLSHPDNTPSPPPSPSLPNPHERGGAPLPR